MIFWVFRAAGCATGVGAGAAAWFRGSTATIAAGAALITRRSAAASLTKYAASVTVPTAAAASQIQLADRGRLSGAGAGG